MEACKDNIWKYLHLRLFTLAQSSIGSAGTVLFINLSKRSENWPLWDLCHHVANLWHFFQFCANLAGMWFNENSCGQKAVTVWVQCVRALMFVGYIDSNSGVKWSDNISPRYRSLPVRLPCRVMIDLPLYSSHYLTKYESYHLNISYWMTHWQGGALESAF